MICNDFNSMSMSAMHELTICDPIECHTSFVYFFLFYKNDNGHARCYEYFSFSNQV